MSEEIQTTTIRTHAPFGRPRAISDRAAKELPAEQVTTWEITHGEPLIEHELAGARRVAAHGLIAANGATQEPAEMLAKGSVYLELCGRTVSRRLGLGAPEAFTPTPDQVNRMPKAVVIEFGRLLEYGRLPLPEELEEEKN